MFKCKYFEKHEGEKGRCQHPDGPIFCDHTDTCPCQEREEI